jgi:hypothetical protein
MRERRRWLVVVVFSMAMAWVESAVVVYLRTMIDRIEPHQLDPLPVATGLGQIELAREVATLIMLWAVGWLAGRNGRVRWAYAVLAFAVWDIAYYAFLKVMDGWPHSLLDWDVLFLLPVPWWGPVLAPLAIAALLAAGATLLIAYDQPAQPLWPGGLGWKVGLLGACVALYTFMADTLAVVAGGVEAVRTVLPVQFNWPLFGLGLALLAGPVMDMGWQLWRRSKPAF